MIHITTVSMETWLSRPWAIEAERCPECQRPQGVIAFAEEADPRRTRWGWWCPACQDPRTGAGDVRADVRWIVGEIRPVVAEAPVRPAVRASVSVMVWSRLDIEIPSEDLSDVMTSLALLARAREVHQRKPGIWALECRTDGTLWAPWCPVRSGTWPRQGDPLPYREGRLGYSKRKRACVACQVALQPGDVVWRPHNPDGSFGSARWVADADQTACVCQSCARKAMARGVETEGGDKVFGPLRLVCGGMDGGDTGSSSA